MRPAITLTEQEVHDHNEAIRIYGQTLIVEIIKASIPLELSGSERSMKRAFIVQRINKVLPSIHFPMIEMK